MSLEWLNGQRGGISVDELDRFNAVDQESAAAELLACNASRRWAERMAAGRPYQSVAAAVAVSAEILSTLTWDDLAEALGAHPRIGERAAGTGREATWSRGEQSGAAGADPEVAAALVAGNRAYEERFGHVFLICATGLDAEDMLADLQQRLDHDDATEREVVRTELIEITALRLEKLFAVQFRPPGAELNRSSDRNPATAGDPATASRPATASAPATAGGPAPASAPVKGAGISLRENEYGKAEVRLVRVFREGDRHELVDLNVSVALAGDLAATHLTGDNSAVLPTDTQKNTVYAFAKDGVGEIEEFGLRLARHFVDTHPAIQRARVRIEQYAWDRTDPASPHSFVRAGQEVRTATVSYDGERAWVVSGLTGLTLLNSTASEFKGYVKDGYTTLPETDDRILATDVTARWRHREPAGDFGKSYREARRHLIEAFAGTYSRSLQQTLYAMGSQVLERRPELCEVRLTLPNRHHLLVDLTPFGLTNPNEVFVAADRPYGLIEGTVARDDAPDAGLAWGE